MHRKIRLCCRSVGDTGLRKASRHANNDARSSSLHTGHRRSERLDPIPEWSKGEKNGHVMNLRMHEPGVEEERLAILGLRAFTQRQRISLLVTNGNILHQFIEIQGFLCLRSLAQFHRSLRQQTESVGSEQRVLHHCFFNMAQK